MSTLPRITPATYGAPTAGTIVANLAPGGQGGSWSLVAGTDPTGLLDVTATGSVKLTQSFSGTVTINNVVAALLVQDAGGLIEQRLTFNLTLSQASGTPTQVGAIETALQDPWQYQPTSSHFTARKILQSLTLTPLTLPAGGAATLTVTGLTNGSTLAASAGDGTTLSVSGNVVTGVFARPSTTTIYLTETLAGALSSPLTTPISFVVSPPAALAITGTLPTALTGQAYSFTPTVTGGTAPYAFQLTGGALPTGLVFSASTGAITGTAASTSTTFGLTLTVTDSLSSTASLSNVTLTVAQGPVAPTNTVVPTITGNAFVGSILTSSTGTWAGSPTSYTYQWKRAGTNIAGATSSTYTVVLGDLSSTLSVTVTATNAQGSASATSTATATVITVPAAPTLSVVAGNAQNTLSWTDGSTGGSTITGHKLYSGTASNGETLQGTIVSASPYVDTGIANDVTRFYKLTAVNAAGESTFSTEQSATPTAPEALTAVQNIGNRGTVMLGATTTSSSNTACKSQVGFRTGRQPVASLSPAFVNWYLNNSTSTPEVAPGNTLTIRACVLEYNNTRVAVTFSGSATATLTDGQTILVADSLPASAFGVSRIPKNAWIICITDVDVPANGNKMVTGTRTNRTSPFTEIIANYNPTNRSNAELMTPGAFTTPTGALVGQLGYHPVMLTGVFTHPESSVMSVGDSLVYGSLDRLGDGENGGGYVPRACWTAGVPYFSASLGGHELAYYNVTGGHAKRAALMAYSTHLYSELMTNDLLSLGTAVGSLLTSNRVVISDAATNLVGKKYISQMVGPLPRGVGGTAYDGTLATQAPAQAWEPGGRKDGIVRFIKADLLNSSYPISELYDPRTPKVRFTRKWTLATAVTAGATSLALIGTVAPRVGEMFALEGDYDGETPTTSTTTTAAITGGSTVSFTISGSTTNRPAIGTHVVIGGESRIVTSSAGAVTLGVNAPFTSSYASGTTILYHSTENLTETGTLSGATTVGATSFVVTTTSQPKTGGYLYLETGAANAEFLLINAATGSAGNWTVSTTGSTATKTHASGITVGIVATTTSVTGSGTGGDPWIVATTGTITKSHPVGATVDAPDLWPLRSYTGVTTTSVVNGTTVVGLNPVPSTFPEELSLEAGTGNAEWSNALSAAGSNVTFMDSGFNSTHASGVSVVAVSTGDLVHPGLPGHVEMASQLATRILTWPLT